MYILDSLFVITALPVGWFWYAFQDTPKFNFAELTKKDPTLR
jgi:hypothetical protein